MKKNSVALLALIGVTAAFELHAASEWNTQDYALYPGDFDGDGRTDVLYISKDSLRPSGIARSDGSGPNIPWQSWPSNYLGISWTHGVSTPIVGDFNGDGRDDVLLQRATPGDHYVLHANSEGKLVAIGQTIPNAHLGVNWSANEHRIISGDFNGDGRDDLFLQAATSSLSNVVALANGAGQFPAGTAAQTWSDTYLGFKWSLSSALVHAGDFTGDGKDDLLIQAKASIVLIDYEIPIPIPTFRPNSFGIVKANDSGAPFGTIHQLWDRNHLGADWSANNTNIVVADFDGDGKDDLFLQAKHAGKANFLFKASAQGQFSSANALTDPTLSSSSGASYQVMAANLNGGAQVGVYLQAISPSGANSYAHDITASTVTRYAHTSTRQVVGRTQGQFEVGSSGGAAYTVPLWTPSGTNGLVPALALSYSSTTANGWLGIGFSIPQLSVITRCRATLAQDSNAHGVNFVPQDKYCIDGQRLRLASGAYAAAGSTYRTELESFRLITMTGVNSYGPTAFEVRTKDGLIYEYGKTPDSSIKLLSSSGAALSTVPLSWAVNSIRDRSGNYIDFTYAQDLTNGGYYPNEIRWTGNTNGTAPKYKIVFVNDSADRPDPIGNLIQSVPYNSGAKGNFSYFKRLGRIDVYYSPTNQLVRRYQLNYEPAGGTGALSRLASIQECGLGASECLAATTFSWYTPTPVAVSASTGQSVPAGITPLVMDMNGDGHDDLVWSSSATSGGGTWYYKIADGASGFGLAVNSGISNTNHLNAHIINWDNDRNQDLIVPLSGGTWWVLRATGTGFAAPFNTGVASTLPTAFADINGDGLDDLIRKFNGLSIRLRSGSAFAAETVGLTTAWPVVSITSGNARRQDFDGDGLEDLVVVLDQIDAFGNHTYKTQTVFGAGSALRSGLDYGVITYVGSGDFNGDQRTDLAWIAGGILRTSISPATGPAASAGNVVIADWDGDGKDDALIGPTTWQFARSTGTGFSAPVSTGIPFTAAKVGDIDGNGFDDLVSVDGGVIETVRHNASTPLKFRDLLKTVSDGFGVSATFAYGSLDDPSVHTSAAGEFALKDSSWPVVKSVVATDGTGTGSTYTLSVTYESAKYGSGGRGFAGFAKRTIVDNRAGHNLKTEETYEQQWPYVGLVKSAVVKQSTGQIILETTNTWKALTYGSDYSVRHFPYIATTTTKHYEVGGPQNGVHVRTVISTLPGTDGVAGIDYASGLVKDVTTTTTEIGTGLFPDKSKSERLHHSAILNDESSNWCVGRPQVTQQTNSTTLSTGAAITRTLGRSWNVASCRLDSTTVEPGNAQWQVVTGYEYDAFGNIKKETVTGAGMTARVTQVFWGAAGQFPEKITNALLQDTTQTFNPHFGLLSGVKDPNTLLVEWSYDNFGRVLQENRPDGTSTTWSRVAYAADAPRVRYYMEETLRRADTAPIKITQAYFDQHDRPYYLFEQVPSGSGYAWSTRKVDFDARGRVTNSYAPWFWGTSPAGRLSFVYDSLDRITAERLYTSANVLDRASTTEYKGLSIAVKDPRDYLTTRFFTAWGDLARVTDAAGGDTDYAYDAFSALKGVTDAYSNVITTIGYNVRGMKTSMTDADTGAWTYLPNALGELEKVRDAKTAAPNWTTQYAYDALGRMEERTEAEGVTRWAWGQLSSAHNIGRLESVKLKSGSMTLYSESLSYDSRGRLQTRSITSDATHAIDYGYDSQTGDLSSLTYPTSTSGVRFGLRYAYSYGQVTRVQRADNGGSTSYWSLNSLDARSNVVDETLGNGVRVATSFDPLTGLMESRQSGPGGAKTIQDLSYLWDKNANLRQRQDVRQSLTEIFNYDALNRLDNSTLNGTENLNVDYNLIGNITKKSDIGASDYTYHPTKKHAVQTAGPYTFSYDQNGNTSNDGQGGSATWYSYNLPNTISRSGTSSQFFYGPDRNRFKQVSVSGAQTETTIYIGGLVEKVSIGTDTSWKHYIAGPTGLVGVYTRRSDGTEDTYHFTKDHLGSIDSISSASGTPLARFSFDAFGVRRKEAGWSGAVPAADMSVVNATTHRSYTEHEFLDGLDLIHMNGRVFNPKVGRFLSPDPIVQAPDNSQSLNRYSYVFNNPLAWVDPSGYCGATSVTFFDSASGGSTADNLRHGSNAPSFNVPCRTEQWWLTFRATLDSGQVGRNGGNTTSVAGLFSAAGDAEQSRVLVGAGTVGGTPYSVTREFVGTAVSAKIGGFSTRYAISPRCGPDVDVALKDVGCDAIYSSQLPEDVLMTVSGLGGVRVALGAARSAGARFIARSSGEILDTTMIRIPGAVNSEFGKLDFLLGRVPDSVKSLGRGKFFGNILGHTDSSLSDALTQHLISNFGAATIRGNRIIVPGTLAGPTGRSAEALSVWQVGPTGHVDLITAYPIF